MQVVPTGQQVRAGSPPQLSVVAAHGMVPRGQVVTMSHVARSMKASVKHRQIFRFRPAQQLKAGLRVLQTEKPQMHTPTSHCSLTVQRNPQLPQWRSSVCRLTHVPAQQSGTATGQSLFVQH